MTYCTVNPRGSAQYRIEWTLNAVSAFVLFCVFMARFSDSPHLLFQAVGSTGLVVIFFLLPLGWVAVWWLNHQRRVEEPQARACYNFANLIQGWAWLVSCAVMVRYAWLYFQSLS